jgi:hypothetical protein
MASCDVCCEKLNKSTNKRVCCVNMACEFIECRKCAEKYLCDTTQNAHCMSCRTGWNREHLEKTFTKTFLNGAYKKFRENLLFDRQKSMLPATQQKAENYKTELKLSEEITEKKKAIDNVKSQLSRLHINYADNAETALRVADEIHALRIQWVLNNEDVHHIETRRRIFTSHGRDASATAPKRQFIKACPAAECRGFLSTAWKCGLCDVWVCPDCHEVKGQCKDADHVCDANTLESVKLLAADTRQCPKCPTMIFKISGCDQMYCTQCHTAFSWRTGQVETGVIHNPHHYEYLRQQNGGVIPRNPGDVPCGEQMLSSQELREALERIYAPSPAAASRRYRQYNPSSAEETQLMGIHRIHSHISRVELPGYVNNTHVDNEDLRIKYMVNEIDEVKFKLLLQQREKANDKKTEIHMVLSTYLAVVMDLMNAVRTFTKKDQVAPHLQALENIRVYTNNSMKPISKRYNCMVPHIEGDTVRSVKF